MGLEYLNLKRTATLANPYLFHPNMQVSHIIGVAAAGLPAVFLCLSMVE